MSLFEEGAGPADELVLNDSPELSDVGQAQVPPPDVSPIVAQTPRLPMPVMPPMPVAPPPPNANPRTQLAMIAALGAALGAGPHSGVGAGVLQGTLGAIQAKEQEDQQRHQQAMQQWQWQAGETDKAQRATQAQQAILDRQNESRLQATFANLRNAVAKSENEDDYKKTIGAYAAGLQASGFRINPQSLMQQFPFQPPAEADQIQEKVKGYFDSPIVKSLMAQNPQAALGGAINYKRNGVMVTLPIQEALKRLGQDIPTTDAQGNTLFSSIGKGPEADQAIQRATEEFKTQFGRTPQAGNPKDNDWITKRAHQFTDKKDPVMEGMQKTLEAIRIQQAQQNLTSKTPSGGLTDEGLQYAATQYRITGVMPSLGMGNKEARSTIVNTAAEQAKQLGQTPAAAIQKQAAFKGDAAALTKIKTLGAGAEASNTKALDQADLIASLSPKVSRTQYPLINDAIISGKTRIAGDENATLLVNAITTFSAEYGKIMEGSTSSGAGSSDTARATASKLVSASLNPRTLQATLNQMKREMQFTIDGYNATADHIGQRMGGAPQAPTATPDTTAPTTSRFTVVQKGPQ